MLQTKIELAGSAGTWLCQLTLQPVRCAAAPRELPPLRGQNQGLPQNRKGEPLKCDLSPRHSESQNGKPKRIRLALALVVLGAVSSRMRVAAGRIPLLRGSTKGCPQKERGSPKTWTTHPGTQDHGMPSCSGKGISSGPAAEAEQSSNSKDTPVPRRNAMARRAPQTQRHGQK